MKKGGGRRYFRPEDISLLQGIKVFLYEKEYPIKDLQEFLRVEGPGKVIAAGAAMEDAESVPEPQVDEPVDKEEAPVTTGQAEPEDDDSGAGQTPETDAPANTLLGALSQLQGARAKLDAALKKG